MMSRREDLLFRQEMRFRNKMVEYISERVMGRTHLQQLQESPLDPELPSNLRDLDQAAMQAVAILLRNLPLQPEENDSGDLLEAKCQLFLKNFSLFHNILNECSEPADTPGQVQQNQTKNKNEHAKVKQRKVNESKRKERMREETSGLRNQGSGSFHTAKSVCVPSLRKERRGESGSREDVKEKERERERDGKVGKRVESCFGVKPKIKWHIYPLRRNKRRQIQVWICSTRKLRRVTTARSLGHFRTSDAHAVSKLGCRHGRPCLATGGGDSERRIQRPADKERKAVGDDWSSDDLQKEEKESRRDSGSYRDLGRERRSGEIVATVLSQLSH